MRSVRPATNVVGRLLFHVFKKGIHAQEDLDVSTVIGYMSVNSCATHCRKGEVEIRGGGVVPRPALPSIYKTGHNLHAPLSNSLIIPHSYRTTDSFPAGPAFSPDNPSAPGFSQQTHQSPSGTSPLLLPLLHRHISEPARHTPNSSR